MACVYCSQRTGKRTCPALGGKICAPCCGEHRQRDISCPSNCVYLGGLAIVRDPTVGFTKADYEAAMARLPAFAESRREFRDAAIDRILEGPPAEWELSLFLGYLYYGHRDERDERLVDHFLAARGRGLPSGEVAALRALQQAWASLFEVVAVQTGTGFDVKDLFTGQTHHIQEVSGTAQLEKRDVLFAWLMPVDDHLELTGSSSLVPREYVDRVREVLHHEIVAERARRPKLAAKDLAGTVSWVVLDTMRHAIAARSRPEPRTTSGENLMFCKAHYAVSNGPEVRARLAKLDELEPSNDGFTWLDRSAGPLVLGSIAISRDELVLETMSRERLARGRQLLETALGDAIAHRIDSLQDQESALREAKKRPRSKSEELPDDVEREFMGEFLRDHYEKWLELPVPALGNKSPRKAVRTKKGRALVVQMLDDLERELSRQPGGETVDVRAMRRSLGLVDEPSGAFTYDAEIPPAPESWLAEDDHVKASAIEAHHATLADHVATPNLTLHTMVHVIVENQLAGGDPPEVRSTLQRLIAAGVTRHDAIHAVGSIVFQSIVDIQKSGKPFDPAKVSRALRKLKAADWKRG